MKKIFSLFMVSILLLSISGCACEHAWNSTVCGRRKYCVKCGYEEGEIKQHNILPATASSPKRCVDCEETFGNPRSEWGFNDLADMGNALVSIKGYNLSEDDYVILNDNKLLKFENGYKVSYTYDVIDGNCSLVKSGKAEKYEIVNNDTLDINNGWDSFKISERKTDSYGGDFVAFVNIDRSVIYTESWYVPYCDIDWSRGIQKDSEGNDILYLK